VVEPLEATVDANERRRAHLEVNVRRAALGRVAEQLIEIQHATNLRGVASASKVTLLDRHAGAAAQAETRRTEPEI
jgi:hypothetical protein